MMFIYMLTYTLMKIFLLFLPLRAPHSIFKWNNYLVSKRFNIFETCSWGLFFFFLSHMHQQRFTYI